MLLTPPLPEFGRRKREAKALFGLQWLTSGAKTTREPLLVRSCAELSPPDLPSGKRLQQPQLCATDGNANERRCATCSLAAIRQA